jgi:hypothetical protein
MPHPTADVVVAFLETYVVIGLLFAPAFVARGVTAVDPMATGSSWGFRLLIVPGTVALWPLLLTRWASGSMTPPVETTAHRRRATEAR